MIGKTYQKLIFISTLFFLLQSSFSAYGMMPNEWGEQSSHSYLPKKTSEFIELIKKDMDAEKYSEFSTEHWSLFQRIITQYIGENYWGEHVENLSNPFLCEDDVPDTYGGAKVTLLKRGKEIEKARKTFENREAGFKEFAHSLYAYAFGYPKLKGILRMVEPLSGRDLNDGGFEIIYEGAKGKLVDTLLTEAHESWEANWLDTMLRGGLQEAQEKPKGALREIAKTLQNFHQLTHKLFYKAPHFESYADTLFVKSSLKSFLPGGPNFEEFKNVVHQYRGYKEDGLHPMLTEIVQQLKWKEEIFFTQNAHLTSDTAVPCLNHGDAHRRNLFFDEQDDSFTMIDYETMVNLSSKNEGISFSLADPSQDVGRFLGSLWDWSTFKKIFGYKFSAEWEKFFLQEYITAWENEPMNVERLKTCVHHYKNKFLLIILTHKKNTLEYKKSLLSNVCCVDACNNFLSSSSRFCSGLVELRSVKPKVKDPFIKQSGEIKTRPLYEGDAPCEEAEFALLDLFQPLITRLPQGPIKSTLIEIQSDLKAYLKEEDKWSYFARKVKKKEEYLISAIEKLQFIKEEIPNGIPTLSPSTFATFGLLIERMKEIESTTPFYKLIIDLRNGIREDILKDTFENEDNGACKHCHKMWRCPGKAGGLPFIECAFCGYIDSDESLPMSGAH